MIFRGVAISIGIFIGTFWALTTNRNEALVNSGITGVLGHYHLIFHLSCRKVERRWKKSNPGYSVWSVAILTIWSPPTCHPDCRKVYKLHPVGWCGQPIKCPIVFARSRHRLVSELHDLIDLNRRDHRVVSTYWRMSDSTVRQMNWASFRQKIFTDKATYRTGEITWKSELSHSITIRWNVA